MNSQLAAAYGVCRHITRSAARNFYYGFLVLPRERRNALSAVYAFMRHSDDLSDDPGFTRREREDKLTEWRNALHRVVAGEHTDDPVLLAVAALPTRAILDRCQAAEQARGRVRTQVWGPRTLDVDIITCGDEVSADPELTLPHPRAYQRAFVLAPWHEVDPDASLPGFGTVADLLAQADVSGVQRRTDIKLRIDQPDGGRQG